MNDPSPAIVIVPSSTSPFPLIWTVDFKISPPAPPVLDAHTVTGTRIQSPDPLVISALKKR